MDLQEEEFPLKLLTFFQKRVDYYQVFFCFIPMEKFCGDGKFPF